MTISHAESAQVRTAPSASEPNGPGDEISAINDSAACNQPLTISGTVANRRVSILIDTGAAVSLIHGSLLHGTNYIQSAFPQLQILTANSSTLQLSGSATVPVSIKDTTIRHCFLVSSELKWNVILGCDFLKRHAQAITFSPTSQSLILKDDEVTVDVNSVDIDTRPPLDPSSIEDILPDNISADDRGALFHALAPFTSVFTWADQAIGRCNVVQHRINTGSAPPQHLPPRRIPFHFREELDKMVENMLQQGIIQPSSSPWAAPVTLVKKKDNSLRLCVDYRRLNAITVRDAFPLPRMDDLLASMAGKKFFSTLDLSSSYWQIEVHPEDRAKTAFSLPSGLFEFTTLPMGLANAAATCQRLMQKLLQNLCPSKCLVYLDDVIVWGTTISELLDNLSEVLTRYQYAGLTLNPKKCKFLQPEIRFFGHIVSREGLKTDPDKIQVVIDWPQPANGDEVRSFLGLAGYYRAFIPSYARLAFPLTRLTEKSRPFKWTTECEDAFSHLKEALTAAPVLSFPDLSRDGPQFILDTDASSHAIGGVLSQTDTDGREHVIQYGSRTLDKSERNYSATRREMLALVSFTKKFAAFLKGKPFIIRTDHSALEWLQNFHEPEGQVARWQEMLADFDFTVVHRPGKQHLNADALSRIPMREPHSCSSCRDLDVNALSVTTSAVNWANLQANDPDVGLIYDRFVRGSVKPSKNQMSGESREAQTLWTSWQNLLMRDRVLFFKYDPQSPTRFVLPPAHTRSVLRELHLQLGHAGQGKLEKAARLRFWSPNLRQDVALICQECGVCARFKHPTHNPRAPLQPISTGYPNQRLGVDIVGPFPQSRKGNRYLLVMVDFFTKWAEAAPLPDQTTATVAEAIMSTWVARFGVPDVIHSDQGANFESLLVHELCSRLGIQKTRTTAYPPQGNGQTERTNKSILSLLRAFIDSANNDIWDTLIPHCLLSYRSTIHKSTGFTPAMLTYGRELQLPLDSYLPTPRPEFPTPPSYITKLIEIHRECQRLARTHLQEAQLSQARFYDRQRHGSPFQPGDAVWLHRDNPPPGQPSKFHNPWSGPFSVVQCLPNNVYRIREADNPYTLIVHFNRLKAGHSLETPDPPLIIPSDNIPVGETVEVSSSSH
nr:unnamed protein product [Spirometra erinaceieuropaei]